MFIYIYIYIYIVRVLCVFINPEKRRSTQSIVVMYRSTQKIVVVYSAYRSYVSQLILARTLLFCGSTLCFCVSVFALCSNLSFYIGFCLYICC